MQLPCYNKVAVSGKAVKRRAYTGVLRPFLYVLTFALTLFIRVRGISTHFWMLWDQIRDWGIALGPFTDLPLVGPPTHFRGYTIGPAFYWVLWCVRVTVGPWFDNLPHAGGIGQAIIESGADALLLTAVWRRTRSVWVALAAIVVVSTAAFDVALSAIVWTTTVASALGMLGGADHKRDAAKVSPDDRDER